jgi:hypothetical protein
MTYEHPGETVSVARAYVYGGEWVAGCPRVDSVSGKLCGGVEFLYIPSRMNGPRDQRRSFFICSYCGTQAPIDWPGQEHEILQVLSMRPVPGTRNWYPQDHPDAVNFHIPHGQTVRDLLDENEAHGVK